MLTTFFSTARRASLVFALAVLFSATAFGADPSLVQLEDRINDLIYGISRSVVTVEAAQLRVAVSEGIPALQEVHTLVASGLICDTLGHILVAATSVIGRDQIKVRCEGHCLDAQLVGVDYRTGLALLNVGGRLGRPARLSPSSQCAGQMVIALGNAYGVRASPSLGFCAGYRSDGMMQFSAPVTSGTIGGGVFDFSGNLVGVIAGGIGPEQNPEAGLAVPATELPDIIRHLARYGDRFAGFLGIRAADFEISPGIQVASLATFASTTPAQGRTIERGVIVTGVAPGSPAAKAGLRSGDLIYAIDGSPVGSAAELQTSVRENAPGMRMEISYLRHDMPFSVRVETARSSELIPTSVSSPGSVPDATLTDVDSLRLEVDRLKRAIQVLEQKLR